MPEALESREVLLVDLQPLPGVTLEQRFAVQVRVLNPNDRELRIDGVDFALDINGVRRTRGSVFVLLQRASAHAGVRRRTPACADAPSAASVFVQ